MSKFNNAVRRALRLPGVPQTRHVAERAVAPYLRADLTSMNETLLEHNHRLVQLEQSIHALERHMPAVLNAIASTNGTARLLRRELDEVLTGSDGAIASLRADFTPHIETLAWLIGRVETVRAEVLYELRYGREASNSSERISAHVVNPDALDVADVRLNLGCGHLVLDGFVNVDMRELPGVDIVAAVDDIPVETGSVAEVFSAHVLEHFPEEELARRLLPYWVSLLRPGGVFRAVVPDLPSMIEQYSNDEIGFEQLRRVTYGGQEYEGDFHFNAFTTERLTELLHAAGLDDIEIIAQGRPNGDCIEFEISGRRAA